MREGHFRLSQYIGTRRLLGEVRLFVEEVPRGSEDAPDVVFDEIAWDFPEIDWKSSVLFGVRYALRKAPSSLKPGSPFRVRIAEVGGYMLDTTELTLAYAAAHALWKALGAAPDTTPVIRAETPAIEFPL